MYINHENGNKLFIELPSCKVSDGIHLIQCYTCQSFGQKSDIPYCLMKNTTDYCCLYCFENHLTKLPQKKKTKCNDFKCFNCLKSSIHFVKS